MAGITKEMIDRINVLARKKRTIGLTEKEAAEQKRLYAAYLTAFRANFKAQLERIEIVDAPGAAEEADDVAVAPREENADDAASHVEDADGSAVQTDDASAASQEGKPGQRRSADEC